MLALKLLEETPLPISCCHVSVAGTETEQTTRLRALVGNQVIVLLIDSGSTSTFFTWGLAELADCTISPVTPVSVKIANGEYMTLDSQVPSVRYVVVNTGPDLQHKYVYSRFGRIWFDPRYGLAEVPVTCDWELETLQFY